MSLEAQSWREKGEKYMRAAWEYSNSALLFESRDRTSAAEHYRQQAIRCELKAMDYFYAASDT